MNKGIQLFNIQNQVFTGNSTVSKSKNSDKTYHVTAGKPENNYGEPVLGLYKNNFVQISSKHTQKTDFEGKSPVECAQKALQILSSTGRKVEESDFEDFCLVFEKNDDAPYYFDSVISARNGAFDTNNIKELLWVLKRGDEESFNELLSCSKPKLNARQISKYINMSKNSDNADFIKKLQPLCGLIPSIKLLDREKFISDIGLLGKFDEINKALYGKKSDEMAKKEEEFFKKHGVRVHMDYDISPDNADFIEDALLKILDSKIAILDDIYITKFLRDGFSGGFSPLYPTSIMVAPFESSNSLGKHALLHETAHLNYYNSIGSRSFLRKPLKNDYTIPARSFVSAYSAVNCDEFIAEVGSMFLDGILKIDDETGEILFKSEYKNYSGRVVNPPAEDIKALVEYYFDLGGQAFPSPGVEVDDSYSRVPLGPLGACEN